MKLTQKEKGLIIITVEQYLQNPSLSLKKDMQALHHKLTLPPKKKEKENA